MLARIRMAVLVVVAAMTVVSLAAPAFAHSEFRPDGAAGGKAVAVMLFVENERSDAGTIKVQLHFPDDQPITLAALPAVSGWTTSVQGGTVGAPVTDVIWSRATAEPENVLLPITLGPLPDQATRLQFKVLQTYSDGEIDRWIQDWPDGSSEPDMPGPIFEVTGGSAPTTSTIPPTSAPTSTVGGSTSTTGGSTSTTGGSTPTETKSDDSDSAVPIAIAIAAAVVLGAGTAYALRRRRA